MKSFKYLFAFVMSFCSAGFAADLSLQFLIDGTKSDTPFDFLIVNNDNPSDQESSGIVKIRKIVNPGNDWTLYVINYEADVFKRIQTIVYLHRKANDLNISYAVEQKRKTGVKKLREILNKSQTARKMADRQMIGLLGELQKNRKIVAFKLKSDSSILEFSGKKIFVGLEVVNNGQFVNIWCCCFDSAKDDNVWKLVKMNWSEK